MYLCLFGFVFFFYVCSSYYYYYKCVIRNAFSSRDFSLVTVSVMTIVADES